MTILLAVIMGGALIAILMVVAEFLVIQETDALTLMVAGSFKELITDAAGVIIFGDAFTLINGAGIGLLLVGVGLFNYRKYLKQRDGAMIGGDPVAPGMEEDSDTTGLAVKNKDEDGGHLYHEMRQYSRGDGAQAPQYEMVPLASSLADLETGGT